MYGAIKDYMSTKGEEFLNPIKEDLFIVLCQNVNEICENNTSNGFVNREGIIDGTYHLIYSLFEPLIKANVSLKSELEKQAKYSTKIILAPEKIKDIL